MSRVFKVIPKRKQNRNGVVISPEMEVIVTTTSHISPPFYNGAVELKERYQQMFGIDLQKGNYSANDFEIQKLD